MPRPPALLAFLIRRCYDFAFSFYSKISICKGILFIALAVVSAASFALGTVSMYIIWSVQDLCVPIETLVTLIGQSGKEV